MMQLPHAPDMDDAQTRQARKLTALSFFTFNRKIWISNAHA
jgi:hypothetical protein